MASHPRPVGRRGERGGWRSVPAKIRVHQLAKELGLTNRETLDLCASLGIAVATHSSSLEDAPADRVRRKAERDGLTRTEQPPEPKVQREPPASDPEGPPPRRVDVLVVLVDASRLDYVRAVGIDTIRPQLSPNTKLCVITLGVGGEVLVPGQRIDEIDAIIWPATLGRPRIDEVPRVIGAVHEVALLCDPVSPKVEVLDLVYWQAFGELRHALDAFGDVSILGWKALGVKQTETQKRLRSEAQRLLRQGPEIERATAARTSPGTTARNPSPPTPPPTRTAPTAPTAPAPSTSPTPQPQLWGAPPPMPNPAWQPMPTYGQAAGQTEPRRSALAVISLLATLWCGVGTLIAPILAVIALVQISNSNGRLKGDHLAKLALMIAALEMLLIFIATLA